MLPNGEHGYVIFACNRAAGYAFMVEKKNGVDIAYTWKQPAPLRPIEPTSIADDLEEVNVDMSLTLDQLNDDCLLTLFDYCDNQSLVSLSDTCKKFSNLLKNYYNFSKVEKTFEIVKDEAEYKMSMTLANVRKMLRLIGPHFDKMVLRFVDRQLYDAKTKNEYSKIIQRFLHEIGKCSKNMTSIRELTLAVQICEVNFIQSIEPIFKNLHTLHLAFYQYDQNYDDFNVDFTELCPNLRRLEIHSRVPWSIFLRRPLSSLQSLGAGGPLTEHSYLFFAFNPQLKCLDKCIISDSQLPQLVDLLPNIEELGLSFLTWEISLDNLLELRTLDHLTKLRLAMIPNDHVSDVIECFTGFGNLRELMLSFRSDELAEGRDPVNQNQESLITLAQALKNLEVFRLDNVKLSDATVVKFLQFSIKLKSLHLYGCDVFATESLVTKLANVRKSSNRETGKLQLFLDEDDRNELHTVYNNNVRRYITVIFKM